MPRPTYRLAAVLCALAMTAGACSSDGEDAVDVEADPATDTTSVDDESTEVTADATGGEGGSDQVAGEDDSTEPPAELVAPGDQFAPVLITGESLEAMPPEIPVTESENDAAIGMIAPELFGTSFDGTPVTVTADGTPRVVMFVAHWCGHCQAEIPAVKALIDQGAVPEGLEIVVVSTAVREGDPNFPPQAWLEAEEWPGPVMRDSPEFDALFAFGAGGFPFTVYLDSEHRVVARSAGQLPADILQQIWLATADA